MKFGGVVLTTRQIMSISIISLMLLMENVDANIISIAVPTIAKSLSTSALNLKLAVTSYLISLAIFIPISGWVSDKFGTKKVLLASVSMFVVFSMLCGFAMDLSQLVLFRFLQGIAGAFMAPIGRLLLLKAFNKDSLVRVYAIMAMPVILGPLFAPLIGGALIAYLNWRYIFWVNLPVGVIGIIITYYYVDNYTADTNKFNWWSFIWLGLFLSLFSFWLDILAFPMDKILKFWLCFLAFVCGAMYLKVEFKSKNPIVNYSLFKNRIFKACFYSRFMTTAAFGGRGFALALFLQISLGMTPLNAGYLLSCLAFGLFAGRMAVNRLLPLYGFKKVMTVANIGASLTVVFFCFVHQVNAFAITLIIVHGAFTSISYMLLNVLIYAKVSQEDYASATSLTNTVQQLSVSMGVVVIASSVNTFNHIFGMFDSKVFYATFTLIGIIGIINQLYFRNLKDTDGDNLIKKKLAT